MSCMTWCASQGITRVRVVSDPHATGFYRRYGAREIGDVPSTPAPRRLPMLEYTLTPDGVPVAE